MEPPFIGIKPGTKVLGLNDKSKAALRNRSSDVKFLIIDGLYGLKRLMDWYWFKVGRNIYDPWKKYLLIFKL